jgi:hypothetical protein
MQNNFTEGRMKMINKKLIWQGEDLIEKIENAVVKIAGVGFVVTLIYVYLKDIINAIC